VLIQTWKILVPVVEFKSSGIAAEFVSCFNYLLIDKIHSCVISYNSDIFQPLNSILACGSLGLLDIEYEVALVQLTCFSLSLRN